MSPEEMREILTGPKVVLLTELNSHQRDEVRALLSQPGFFHLLGLMLGEREGFNIQMRNLRLTDPVVGAQALGVLQGKASAVDNLRETVIECASVPNASNEVMK